MKDDRQDNSVTSAEARFPPCLDADIPGAVNLRDLGDACGDAAVIRRGMLFRSGITHQLDPEGLALLRTRLGIRTVIDLRSDAELRHDGVAPFAQHGIAHRRMAIYGVTAVTPGEQRDRFHQMARGEFDWCARYQVMLVEHAQSFVEFFNVLSQPDALPAVFHCSAGRDRTGVAAALLLNVLGVPDEAIAADYARTGALLLPHLQRYARMRDSMGLTDEQMAALLMTEARVMSRFMSWLRKEYGSAADMLLGAGLSAATLSGLKGRLLQGA